MSNVTTQNFKVIDCLRPQIDGQIIYKRILIQRTEDEQEIFGNFVMSEDGMSINFEKKDKCETAYNFLTWNELPGDEIAIPKKQDALLFWQMFVNRMEKFAKELKHGPVCDMISYNIMSLEDNENITINPGEIIHYLISMTRVDYEVYKNNHL